MPKALPPFKRRKNVTYFGYYPIPLPARVRASDSLQEWARDRMHALAGEGQLVEHHTPDGGMYLVEYRVYVLPQEWEGMVYLIRYGYTMQNGCELLSICEGVK